MMPAKAEVASGLLTPESGRRGMCGEVPDLFDFTGEILRGKGTEERGQNRGPKKVVWSL